MQQVNELAAMQLQRKDDEIDALKQRIALLEAREALAAERLKVCEEQRSELLQRVGQMRIELELCHNDVIVPVREELSRARQAAVQRDRELAAAKRCITTLQDQNKQIAEQWTMIGSQAIEFLRQVK